MDQDSYLLIDEADFILIDGAQKVANKKVTGPSATTFNDELQYEKSHLQNQGFQVYDSHMSGYLDPNTAAK